MNDVNDDGGRMLMATAQLDRLDHAGECPSAAAPQTEERPAVTSQAGSCDFHLFMAFACSVILAVSVLGCWLASIHVIGVGSRLIAILAMVSMVMPVPAYWHMKGRTEMRDAALTIPWAMLLAMLLPYPILVGARLHMPLRDASFAHIDRLLGVSVPGIMACTHGHWIGLVLAQSYYLLTPLLLGAIFIPALTGRVRHAKEFVVANVIAFAIAVPAFSVLPAVGPWNFYGFSPGLNQQLCESQLLALRLPGTYSFLSQGAGLLCFPSFHVAWAVLCAAALWGFKPLRIPVAILCIAIILSTLTTGWHYFVDVLGGLVLAVICLLLAKLFVRYGWSLTSLARLPE